MTSLQVQKIWQQAPHNAFTDLACFRQAFWCVFREGTAHVSPDGSFRILRSADAENWQPVALITHPSADLRDAKLSILPDGRLLLLGAGALHDRSQQTHQSYIWLSDDGYHWSDAVACGEADIWLWRLSWHQQTAYALGYKCGKPHFVRLYQSHDARHFHPLSPSIYQGSYANESGLLFEPDGTALCLLRRDPDNGLFGTAQPPYTDWQWQDIGCRIGGPQWVQLDDGRLLACVRLYDSDIRTSLVTIDKKDGKLSEIISLPSSGDCSYAGMVLQEQQLYISYYSSHEGKSAIYLATLDVRKSGI
ncbi:exo-alpha-sialidase [Chromatiaceae bacterium AAb-1]|nr:exo-alpha-sialidase [Chromatiaceae bacterium AAb-1]